LRVRHLGMELHAVPAPGLVLHHRYRNAGGRAGNGETRRRLADVVAMTHPHVELVRTSVVAETVEQPALRHDVDFGMTELALIGRFGGTAQLRGQRLHAVAD